MARARTHQLLTVLLLSSAPAGAWPGAPAAPHAPPDDAHAPRALLDLRAEMMKAGHDKAQADVGRFRALCDPDGYPLVGNLVEKSSMYQPSQFCSDVRKREHRS
ncbi:MAG TPA: hypothetical protein VHW23_47240 [Kofleriaceae bacterium]|jgi:hypothetical protein|nr:hypothetical protein [Kofleriaceae bacterium]